MSSTCPHNMVNFGLLAAEIGWPIWDTPPNFNGLRVLSALLHRSTVVSVSQTLQHWTEGATYVWQGDHHVGHWPTFLVLFFCHGTSIVASVLNSVWLSPVYYTERRPLFPTGRTWRRASHSSPATAKTCYFHITTLRLYYYFHFQFLLMQPIFVTTVV